jgi:uncharacterized membrane protein
VTREMLAAVAGMAAITYGVRAGGLLMARRLPQQGLAARWLRQIPPAILAAIIAPAIVSGGPADIAAGAATAVVAVTTRNLFAAVAAGVATVWALRTALG